MARKNIFELPFAQIYPLYISKVEKKGRAAAEVDAAIAWLTGYSDSQLHDILADDTVTLQRFFDEAPRMNENARLITGVICGYRVEEITDPLMQKVRYLDKLVDEIARGKAMEKVLRSSSR